MHAVSRQIATMMWSGALAILLTLVTGGIWTALLVTNLTTSPEIPWAVAMMGLLLWLIWRYLGGAWWPRSTSDARYRFLRARPLPGRIFAWALTAGLLSIVALAGLWLALFQVAGLPARALPDYSNYPPLTVSLTLIMASLVGAITEESGFRGYFQGSLEGIFGSAAIVITALVMAPEHALTQGFVWPTLLFYFFVDLMFGLSAYLTQSILPGIVTHTVGLLVFFTLVWPSDILRQWVGHGGANIWLWVHVAQVATFGTLAILAFIQLGRTTRAAPVAERVTG